MNEPTNGAGIPIRIGQVWEDDYARYLIVGFDEMRGDIVMRNAKNIWGIPLDKVKDNIVFTELISDPVWGDMSEWRIVTDAEKREHGILYGMQYLDEGVWKTITNPNATIPLPLNALIRIHRTHKWAEAAQEQPEENRLDRNCRSCAHENLNEYEEPCADCENDNAWQPKEEQPHHAVCSCLWNYTPIQSGDFNTCSRCGFAKVCYCHNCSSARDPKNIAAERKANRDDIMEQATESIDRATKRIEEDKQPETTKRHCEFCGCTEERHPLDPCGNCDGAPKSATIRKEGSAVDTLERLGYTYHGGVLWKPPIGKKPEWIDQQTQEQPICVHCDSPITHHRQSCRRMNGMCVAPQENEQPERIEPLRAFANTTEVDLHHKIQEIIERLNAEVE